MPKGPSKPKRILIVDDESTLVFFLQQGIKEANIACKLEVSPSGEDALTKLTYQSFDLIITDLRNSDTTTISNEYEHYFQILKKLDKFVIAIDDIQPKNFPSDIYIVPYVGIDTLHSKLQEGSTILLGPEYFIFSKEIWQ